MTSQEDDTEEDYLDDPIKLNDGEEERVDWKSKSDDRHLHYVPYDSDGDVFIQNQGYSHPLERSLPLTFFEYAKNIHLLNKCKPLTIKLTDFRKHKGIRKKGNSYIIGTLNKDIISMKNKSKICVDEDGKQKMKLKNRPVNSVHYAQCKQLSQESSNSKKECIEKNEIKKSTNKPKKTEKMVDIKKNIGLVGLKIQYTPTINTKTKTSKNDNIKNKKKKNKPKISESQIRNEVYKTPSNEKVILNIDQPSSAKKKENSCKSSNSENNISHNSAKVISNSDFKPKAQQNNVKPVKKPQDNKTSKNLLAPKQMVVKNKDSKEKTLCTKQNVTLNQESSNLLLNASDSVSNHKIKFYSENSDKNGNKEVNITYETISREPNEPAEPKVANTKKTKPDRSLIGYTVKNMKQTEKEIFTKDRNIKPNENLKDKLNSETKSSNSSLLKKDNVLKMVTKNTNTEPNLNQPNDNDKIIKNSNYSKKEPIGAHVEYIKKDFDPKYPINSQSTFCRNKAQIRSYSRVSKKETESVVGNNPYQLITQQSTNFPKKNGMSNTFSNKDQNVLLKSNDYQVPKDHVITGPPSNTFTNTDQNVSLKSNDYQVPKDHVITGPPSKITLSLNPKPKVTQQSSRPNVDEIRNEAGGKHSNLPNIIPQKPYLISDGRAENNMGNSTSISSMPIQANSNLVPSQHDLGRLPYSNLIPQYDSRQGKVYEEKVQKRVDKNLVSMNKLLVSNKNEDCSLPSGEKINNPINRNQIPNQTIYLRRVVRSMDPHKAQMSIYNPKSSIERCDATNVVSNGGQSNCIPYGHQGMNTNLLNYYFPGVAEKQVPMNRDGTGSVLVQQKKHFQQLGKPIQTLLSNRPEHRPGFVGNRDVFYPIRPYSQFQQNYSNEASLNFKGYTLQNKPTENFFYEPHMNINQSFDYPGFTPHWIPQQTVNPHLHPADARMSQHQFHQPNGHPLVPHDNLSIIGRNNDGVVRKINIGATTPVQEKNKTIGLAGPDSNSSNQPTTSKFAMLEERNKIPISNPLKSHSTTKQPSKPNSYEVNSPNYNSSQFSNSNTFPINKNQHKTELRKPISVQPTQNISVTNSLDEIKLNVPTSYSGTNSTNISSLACNKIPHNSYVGQNQAVTPNQNSRPQPLPKKPRLGPQPHPNEATLNQIWSSPFPNTGYLPPILPISTYEKTYKYLEQETNKISLESRHIAQRENKNSNISDSSLQGTNIDKSVKKISVDEYKKRSLQVPKSTDVDCNVNNINIKLECKKETDEIIEIN